MTELDFDRVTEEYRRALLEIVRGNPDVYKQMYSDAEDITIRVTSIFVREGGEWKLAHRHADPRVSLVQPELVFRTTQAP